MNGHDIKDTLIDIGAEINVLPLQTLKNIQISELSPAQSTIKIATYDQTKTLILGKIIV